MNKEFMERYRTAIFIVLSIILTAFVMWLAYKKDNINYLDRGLLFFAGMSVFFIFRNLIRTIKLNNQAIGLQIEAQEKEEQEKQRIENEEKK